jgi:hypothetical protein
VGHPPFSKKFGGSLFSNTYEQGIRKNFKTKYLPYVFETKSKNLLQARLDQEATPGYGCMPAGHEL